MAAAARDSVLAEVDGKCQHDSILVEAGGKCQFLVGKTQDLVLTKHTLYH